MRLCKILVLFAALAGVQAFAQIAATQKHPSAEILLQRGVKKEFVDGDLNGAIEEYKQILTLYSANRSAAAKALLYLGQCYEKLGKVEARTVYERTIREYADQQAEVKRARARLSALAAPDHGDRSLLARRVWSGRDVEVFSISSDGHLLSVVDWDSGDLAIRNVSTGENRRLTGNESWMSPSFTGYVQSSKISPDGKWVVYDWRNALASYRGELRLIGIDGSGGRVLYRSDNVLSFNTTGWSLDGQRIAVGLSRANHTNQIAVVSVGDGSARVLKTTDWRSPRNMAFSPDGKYIVYDFPPSQDSSDRDVYLLSVDDARETRLVEHPGNDTVLGWTPDGQHVLFASDRSGTNDVWVISISRGSPQGLPELVKKNLGPVLPLGLTQNGTYYYGMAVSMLDVFIASLDSQTKKITGNSLRVAKHFIGTNSSPDWSPDGQSVVYLSGRGRVINSPGSRILCISSIETGEQHEIPLNLNYITRPRWDPDGRHILIRAEDERDRSGLFLVDTATHSATLLIERQDIRDWAWSRDGKFIYYTVSSPIADGNPQLSGRILAYDLRTGSETEVFRQLAPSNLHDGIFNNLAVSPDGNSLAFTFMNGPDSMALMTMALTDGRVREIYRLPKDSRMPLTGGLSWMLDNQEILFVTSRIGANTLAPETRNLWAISLNGSQPRPVGLNLPNLSQVRVDPGALHVTYTAGDDRREVWVMENFLAPGRTGR